MDRRQRIAIFTTASLTWMIGTAINPLFCAAYLAKGGDRKITLVIPWLSLKDQKLVYSDNAMFGSPWEQESYIRQWLERRIAFIPDFDKRSIIPVGDISEIISDEEADIPVIEEPGHLTWFHQGKRWKTKFRLVIGIMHTNYLEYVKREKNGRLLAFLLKYLNSWVVSIYCHKVIRLSTATQDYPRSIICNVHGVNPKFLEMVWSKGYGELLKLIRDHQKELAGLEIDMYGNGEDSDQVKEAANKLKLVVRVHPGCDHADPLFHDYEIFLNPSTTDVVCTTTAEALAMGKIVICANHPSNDFFKQFSN
ncbi:digalactosyldiacylglycerol synthase 2, chloroplastic [Gossypium australe]|uniref:digalactosyldiacylglycerol synthase n=1 Tax=Gossypium australe TaxID=47621 RepID=A0A5B6UY80_9ROSI|nr:digalactosyldiacylglycerol synthase 2, chloroplastic [Gossypium australe]